jgi:hypothetical protein
MTESMKPCFVDLPEPRIARIDSRLSNTDSFRLKIPGCECRVPSGSVYFRDEGYANAGAGTTCPCTISPCAADALEQLQLKQVTQAGSITKLESTIKEIKLSLDSPENTTNPVNPSSPEPIKFASVHGEVRKWLSQRI